MWYILPIGGLYATYHLLGEPGTTIEKKNMVKQLYPKNHAISKLVVNGDPKEPCKKESQTP